MQVILAKYILVLFFFIFDVQGKSLPFERYWDVLKREKQKVKAYEIL